jgi:folate-binding protein YgfZ
LLFFIGVIGGIPVIFSAVVVNGVHNACSNNFFDFTFMMIPNLILTSDTRALRTGAALQLRPDGGVLILDDADRSDFLHRMTTNEIKRLPPGQSTVTVLTSPTARILFVFTVVNRGDDLLLLPARGQTAALARQLRGQIFFMDQVKVRDASAEFARLRLMGPAAGAVLGTLGFTLAAAADGACQTQGNWVAVKQEQYDVPGYELVIPRTQLEAAVAQLTASGANVLTDEAAYDAQRIAIGRPAPGYELTEAYNPLEAGLAWTCADNKGCYTGQEIIARQITYDKVTKSLVGLRASALLATGAEVKVNGQSVGQVTSAALSPPPDAPLALAILKRPYNTPGSVVTVDGVAAEVVALPFVMA